MRNRSILVVGSGVIGLSTAYFLAKAGHQVTVLDGRPGPGLDASFANGGLLTPSMSDPWNAPGIHWNLLKWIGRADAPMLLRLRALPSLFGWGIEFLRNTDEEKYVAHTRYNMRLAAHSLDMLRQIRAETNIHYDCATCGTIKLFRDAKSLHRATDFIRQVAAHGLHFKRLDTAAVIALEPALEPIRHQIRGGLFYPQDEVGDARKFCGEMVALSTAQGCEFRFSTKVSRIVLTDGVVTGVQTSEGFVAGDAIVIAAGPDSKSLASSAGIKLPVRPVKGYSITMPRPDSRLAPSIPVIDDTLHAAVTPIGDRIRVAGTAEFAGYDRSVDPVRIQNLKRLLRSIYPAIADDIDDGDMEPWAGLRSMTATGIPIIGETTVKDLFVNTGHGHLGWSMATGSGRLLADIISGTTPDIFQNGSPAGLN